jgi:hypothetical protein
VRLLAHTLAQRLSASGTGGDAKESDGISSSSSSNNSSKEALEVLARAGSTHLNSGGRSEQQQRSHAAELPAGVRKRLSKKNELDQTLYDWARADFYRRLCDQLGECDGPPTQPPQPPQEQQQEQEQEKQEGEDKEGYALDSPEQEQQEKDDGYALDGGYQYDLEDGYVLDQDDLAR